MYFYKGSKDILAEKKADSQETDVDLIKKEILQVFDVKNLSFLLGAGCSSFVTKKSGKEIDVGIPVMSSLATDFYSTLEDGDKKYLKETIKINPGNEPYRSNLEKLLEVLYSYKFLLESQGADLTEVDGFIGKVTNYLLKKCINEDNNKRYDDVKELYKLFYKKLIYRDNNLSKTNVFTTNYDLYSETALDELGILFTNGFSGLIERYFNPIVFNYAYAEQMELTNSKWNVIDNFIYLYKLHGSVNWVEAESDNHLFKVAEKQTADASGKNVIIYPTPMKQVASFASPYSDLFREFQKKLMQDRNVLIIIGYSFSDEHINNLIYQALTIPNFRLILFQDDQTKKIKDLIELNDPRIWVVGGEESGEKAHYFQYIVNNLLPDIDQEKIEESIDKVVKNLLKKK